MVLVVVTLAWSYIKEQHPHSRVKEKPLSKTRIYDHEKLVSLSNQFKASGGDTTAGRSMAWREMSLYLIGGG